MTAPHSPLRDRAPRPTPPGGGLSVPRLAHELNSRLDGSLRSLGLAERTLAAEATTNPALSAAAAKLAAARCAMQEMAAMLESAMHGRGLTETLTRPDSLAEQVEHAVRLAAPMAAAHVVDLMHRVDPAAVELRGTALETVLVNGLRNAIEACAAQPPTMRRVELSVLVDPGRDLVINIADTGCGLPDDFQIGRTGRPDGHGLGLEVSREIVEGLGGSLRLIPVPYGLGTIMQVQLPLAGVDGP